MAIVRPFKGIRPIKELASKIAALPYDVMNSEEARKMVVGNPYSFLHVMKPPVMTAKVRYCPAFTIKQKRPAGINGKTQNVLNYLSVFVAETAFNEINQSVYCCLFVLTVSNDADLCAADDTQRKDTQQALCVYTAFFLFDPDRGLELVGTLNEKCSRSCVQTNLILYSNFFYKHDKLSHPYDHACAFTHHTY